MKTLKLLALTLTVLSGLSLPVFAQGPAAERAEPVLQSLDSKLDVILRRLDAIEKRLGQLELQGSFPRPVREAGMQKETYDVPADNWYRPRTLAIPHSVDAGMLIDGMERAQEIENPGVKDPFQNLIFPKHDGVIVKEPMLRHR